MVELGIQDLIVFIGGIAIGLWIAVQIEIETGKCVLEHHDRLVYPNRFKNSKK